jgi:hypothetical protein
MSMITAEVARKLIPKIPDNVINMFNEAVRKYASEGKTQMEFSTGNISTVAKHLFEKALIDSGYSYSIKSTPGLWYSISWRQLPCYED